MNHYILTRYNVSLYSGNPYNVPCADTWMDRRRVLFRDTADSIKRQTCQAFEWWVAVDPRTPECYLRGIRMELPENGRIVESKTLALTDLPYMGPCITSRLDSDDRYLPGFVVAVQREAAGVPAGGRLVVDVRARKKLRENNATIPLKRSSPDSFFISLVENTSQVLGVCHVPHTGIHNIYPAVKIEEVLAECIIHGGNLANRFA